MKKRHLNGRVGDQFTDMSDDALKHILRETVEGGEMVAEQIENGERRFVFEKAWGRIGTRNQRIARVVISETGQLVTAFPVRNAMRAAGTGAAGGRVVGRLLRAGARVALTATVVGALIEVGLSPTPAGSTTCTGVCQE